MTDGLPLQESTLDPCGTRRDDRDWLRDRWGDPGSRIYTFCGEEILVTPDGAPDPVPDPALPRDDLPAGDWVFLGTDDRDRAVFAMTSDGPLPPGRSSGVRALGVADAYADDLAVVVSALGVLNWHRRHPRCPQCGEATELDQGGWSRVCPADASRHFPRVDPAVIMLVTDTLDRALLGRQSRWPETWFSTLAGFVEPGETLDNTVAREVAEEVGLRVTGAQYRGSQPWPFPSSLMIGFHATVADGDPVPDAAEIAEARWFTRDRLADACAAGEVRLPPRFSISRWLIELWFGRELPGDWSRE